MEIVSIKKVLTQDVYDITVEDAHHYILENGVVSHNSGTKYSASNIIFLSKKKDRDDKTKDVLGNFIKCNLVKGRMTKENKSVTVKLSYETGLDRYYGLTELAIAQGVFKKLSKQIELPDGTKVFESAINKNPAKFFTPEVLSKLEEAAKKEFMYGSAQEIIEDDMEEHEEHISEKK